MKRIIILILLFGLVLFHWPVDKMTFAANIDPDNEDYQFAWGENPGWLNFEPAEGPGVTVTDTDVNGYAWGENIGWINLSPAQAGVVNDGDGNLSGYAWSENVGWISFSCTNTNTCATVDYGIVIDGATGEFSGYAWGENIGWISLSPTNGGVKTGWNTSTTDTEPLATITSPSADTTIQVGDAVNFQASVTNGNPPYTYLWEFNGGASNVNTKDPGEVIFSTSGVYGVTFTVTDDDGNTDSATVVITVDPTDEDDDDDCFVGTLRN